jgi:hypothetical protein
VYTDGKMLPPLPATLALKYSKIGAKMEYDEEYPSTDQQSEIDELRDRLDELENPSSSDDSGVVVMYVFGSSLAMILSWSRNASILWCVGHGITSWITWSTSP